ncbi:hypothetical protein BH10ACI2_BH10ACI2_18110 [soil metagenome]
MWSNLSSLLLIGCICFLCIKYLKPQDLKTSGIESDCIRPPGDWRWDLIFIGVGSLVGAWAMLATLTYSDGNVQFAIGSWSDFGANLSLTQSLALGNNYPTEHPFFPGEIIHYHFLFWYLAANLSYLGLNFVWAINLLSFFSLICLLILMMTFAEQLFNSRAAGRISLIFFFLSSSSLYYIPYLLSQPSLSEAIAAILVRKVPLISGFPYHGEGWGSLSIITFINQRQLISAIGVILMVLIALVMFYRRKGAFQLIGGSPASASVLPEVSKSDIATLAFCGVLIGCLPYWNTAVFLSAAVIVGGLLVLFPFRPYLLALVAAATVVGLPQILLLRSGNLVPMGATFFTWGYTIVDPTAAKVAEYLLWTFGFKLLLIVLAMWFVPSSHRRFFIALTLPAIVAFSVQLSVIMVNNHKLLNVWGVVTASYIAYAIWIVAKRFKVAGIALAVIMTLSLTLGAIIDLFPIHNDAYIGTPYGGDRLTTWVIENTQPTDIFLTEMYLSHPILMAGRKIFFGNTLLAWGAGYKLQERDSAYKEMFKTNDPSALIDLLHANHIKYIAVDDGLRNNENSKSLDESMLFNNFELVFDDVEKKYGNMKIYSVP